MATKIVTGVVRFSYLKATEGKPDDKGNIKYGTMIIVPKSDKKTIRAIKEAIEEAYQEGKSLLGLKNETMPSKLKQPLYDGDDERPDDPACEDAMYFNASSNRKIEILDGEREPITNPDLIYSGMYGRASVTFKAYNADSKSKGIACYINAIQKTKNGERLDGVTSGAKDFDDDFEDFEDDEDFTPKKKSSKNDDDFDDL